MATKKTIKKDLDNFSDLKDFKDFLLSKSKFTLEDIAELFKIYIQSVWFFHFKKKISWSKYDEDIDLKLRWIYELNKSIQTIIEENDKIKKSN